MVMSWMSNSMKPDMSDRLYELNTTIKARDTLCELYTNKDKLAQIYEVKQMIPCHRQWDKSHFWTLHQNWKENSYFD